MLKQIVLAVTALFVIVGLAGYLWLADRAQRVLADDFFEDAIVAFQEADRSSPRLRSSQPLTPWELDTSGVSGRS